MYGQGNVAGFKVQGNRQIIKGSDLFLRSHFENPAIIPEKGVDKNNWSKVLLGNALQSCKEVGGEGTAK